MAPETAQSIGSIASTLNDRKVADGEVAAQTSRKKESNANAHLFTIPCNSSVCLFMPPYYNDISKHGGCSFGMAFYKRVCSSIFTLEKYSF